MFNYQIFNKNINIILLMSFLFVFASGKDVGEKASNCDMVLNSDISKSGTFSSPMYPSSYLPRTYCRYDFQGRGKERVQIVFSDFNLHHSTDDSKECDGADTLEAYVQIEGRMEKIDSFCAGTIPRPIMSNGPRMLLEFRGVQSSRHVRGFKATYRFTENFGITSGRQLEEFPCAFVYNSTESRSGVFSSPNYPGAYPRDTECHYFFNGVPQERVRLHFTYFDVEGVLPCEAISASDYVEFSNFMATDRKYDRYCGQLRDFTVESDRKFFRVNFRSNDRLDGTGFHASYSFINEGDVATMRPDSGISTSNALSSPKICVLMILIIAMLLINKHD